MDYCLATRVRCFLIRQIGFLAHVCVCGAQAHNNFFTYEVHTYIKYSSTGGEVFRYSVMFAIVTHARKCRAKHNCTVI